MRDFCIFQKYIADIEGERKSEQYYFYTFPSGFFHDQQNMERIHKQMHIITQRHQYQQYEDQQARPYKSRKNN
jgi:hypothetical protein